MPFTEIAFGLDGLYAVRTLVGTVAASVGLSRERVYDVVLAVNELAANSIAHGGGSGTLRVWTEVDRVICEFRDSGHLDDPMAGREQPPVDGIGHRGIWMVNQLCDLVQIRVFPSGTIVRVHMQFG